MKRYDGYTVAELGKLAREINNNAKKNKQKQKQSEKSLERI